MVRGLVNRIHNGPGRIATVPGMSICGRTHGRAPRWRGHDLRDGDWYFVTCCVVDRLELLAEVTSQRLRLTLFGLIVDRAWRLGLEVRSEVSSGPRVVMPNHLHALVRVGGHPVGGDGDDGAVSLHQCPRSISTLMSGFKSASTGEVNRLRGTSGRRLWQAGYYDRVVRDDAEWWRIARYFGDNPAPAPATCRPTCIPAEPLTPTDATSS
jgi:hypothetical protein